jgi:phasin
MNKPVTDLTPEELELLASEAWSVATREAMAKGLAVTGSRDGRRYRYHPDGHVDDLGPVGGSSATPVDMKIATASKTRTSTPAVGAFEMPKFEMPKFDIPKVEMPAAFREYAERGVAQAKDTYEKMKAAAEEATDALETTYSTASKGTADYGLKVIEVARANTNAAFDFYGELITAKTLSEVIELSSAHARKQFEALTAQSKELGALAQKVATETAEPLKSGVSESIKSSARKTVNKAS